MDWRYWTMSSTVQFAGVSGQTYAYQLDAIIGRGRYGRVFRGVDEMTGQAVAIKCIPIDTSTATRYVVDGTLVERELDIMRQLTLAGASHVMPLTDYAQVSSGSEDELRLVIPKADGTLDERVRQAGTLSEDDARTLLLALSTGMRHMHSVDVYHRDINPRNVLMLDGQWVLSDFGIAKDHRRAPSTTTWEGTGTVEYWAPELFRGESASPQSDMFAAGATVLEALTGTVIFPGPRHHDQRVNFDIQGIRVTDTVLSRAIARLLAIEPSNRPRSAEEITHLLASRSGVSTEAQRRFEGLLQTHVAEDRKRDETLHAELRVQALQRTGLSGMRHIWGQLVVETQAMDPNVAEANQDDLSSFDRTLVVGSDRLRVEVRSPSDRSLAVLVGEVSYSNRDTSGGARVANIVCTESAPDDSLTWRLTRYSRNQLHPQSRPETHNLNSQGVDLGLLEQQLSGAQQRVAANILVEESGPLTSDALLTVLVDAADRLRESL